MESIDTVSAVLASRENQNITYTSFNKVDSLTNGIFLINFDYGPSAERVRMQVSRNDTLQYTRYYFGAFELTEYPDNSYEQDTWFTGDGGVFGFNRVTSTTDSIYYIIKDHLGSVMTIAGEEGAAKEYLSYDAWGRRRNATDWSDDTTLSVNYTSRGYTGHEHIDEASLINMNGRIYDPIIGLFLSPDPIIQSPTNPLNYNQYSYVMNNPLKYTDPSGYYRRWNQETGVYDWVDQFKSPGYQYMESGGEGSGGNSLFSWEERVASKSWEYNGETGKFYNYYTGKFLDPSKTETVYVGTGEYMTVLRIKNLNTGKETWEQIELLDEILMWHYTLFDQTGGDGNNANFALGAACGVLAGENGAGLAVNEFKAIQRASDLNNLGLDYTNKLSAANRIVKGLKIAGYATSGISLYLSYNQWQSGEIDNSKFALDVFMTGYSHLPVVGWAGGLLYYSIDNLYPGGIYGFGNDYSIQHEEFQNSVGFSMRSLMH